jgi:hypothetical protein
MTELTTWVIVFVTPEGKDGAFEFTTDQEVKVVRRLGGHYVRMGGIDIAYIRARWSWHLKRLPGK